MLEYQISMLSFQIIRLLFQRYALFTQ